MNSYVPTSEVHKIERSYRRNKSIPTSRHLTVKVRSEGDKKYSEYICVVYTFVEEYTVSEPPSKYEDEDKVEILPLAENPSK